MNTPGWISRDAAAHTLNKSKKTIDRYIKAGKLEAISPDGWRVLVSMASVTAAKQALEARKRVPCDYKNKWN